MPKVSVIIPSYNRASLISQTIDSALNQTYKDYEIIVVDDGSTDETLVVLAKYDRKIQIIPQPHSGGGGAQARNTGISAANGEYIALLDSDDLWMPTKLEREISLLDDTPGLLWVYSDAEFFDNETGRTLSYLSQKFKLPEGDILLQLLMDDFIPTPTHILHRSVFENVGGFWPSPKGTDWDMNLRIAGYCPIKLISEPLTRIRVHQDSVTAKLSLQEALEARLAIVKRAVERDPERLLPFQNKALSHVYTNSGQMHALKGNIQQARLLLIEAIKHYPFAWDSYISLVGTLIGQQGFKFARHFRRFLRTIGLQLIL